jgi:hypothetical protein
MAGHHRVPGVVYRSLTELDVDDADFDGLRGAYQMATLAHGRCLIELETRTEILDELECPRMVVKGRCSPRPATATPVPGSTRTSTS